MTVRIRGDKRVARGATEIDLAALVARWPGPAAHLDADGAVRCANAGAPLVLAALSERGATLADLARAEAGRTLAPITLADPAGPVTLEVMVVPTSDGALIAARDVSLSVNVRAALTESRRRYKDLVEISSDFVWETDRAGAFVFVSPRGALGYTAAALLGRDSASLLIEPPESGGAGAASPFAARRRREAEEIWLRGADGAPVRMAISALPLLDAEGAPAGARGLCRDVSAAFAREATLAEAQNNERLLAYIMRVMRDETEAEPMLTAAATAIARALGAAGAAVWRDEVDGLVRAAQFGETPPDLDPVSVIRSRLSGDAAFEIPARSARLLGARTSYRGAMNGVLALWRDAARPAWTDAERVLVADAAGQLGIALAQLAQHEMLARLATTDALTGLLNRRAFTGELARRLAGARRAGRAGALLFVDLDNFKLVNDHHGHQRGDEALKLVAAHLKARSRLNDLAARLGGDEFALWLEDTDRAGALSRAEALRALDAELALLCEELPRKLSLSIGIAMHGAEAGEREEALIARADAAMYQAKHGGKDAIVVAPAPGPTAS